MLRASKIHSNVLLKNQSFLKPAFFSSSSVKVQQFILSSYVQRFSNNSPLPIHSIYKRSILSQDLSKVDPKLFNILELEKQRQRESIVLIPSEVGLLSVQQLQ